MASNFSFCPMGVTSLITVSVTAATATFWLVGGPGGTRTLALASGSYAPTGFRIANVGTVACFIQFGAPNDTISIALTNAIPVFQNTVESFAVKGHNCIAYMSSGTCTLYITPGEGI